MKARGWIKNGNENPHIEQGLGRTPGRSGHIARTRDVNRYIDVWTENFRTLGIESLLWKMVISPPGHHMPNIISNTLEMLWPKHLEDNPRNAASIPSEVWTRGKLLDKQHMLERSQDTSSRESPMLSQILYYRPPIRLIS